MNDREKYKKEMIERLSVSMYNMIDRRESLDKAYRVARTSDYNLMQIRREVLQRINLPPGVCIDLRGYEIILKNPTPVYIRFGIGNYWIGSHLFAIRSLEQIVDMMAYTISDVIPCSMAAYEKQNMNFEKEFNKYMHLKLLNEVAEQLKSTNNLQYGYQY